ncbi:type II toxin-antitoxin system ParD family antitoxin [Amaricoccus sp.]|uniref:ribbon-helix-helix domain-containing protein n=1 Tax=Amaricoccus sp. TaxID=1872485 RepID=UPI001B6D08E5|nr:type II toxin-antitoxin system ParD family antitoxin [Amaricoccus sp.]MBP7000014.1 type II toxin-antitoxin system ParD family antitoxin [Amaricoccus sp.]
MTIDVDLGEHWDAFVRAQLASGSCATPEAVVIAGLAILEDEGRRLAALRAHLAEGQAQAERGEFGDDSLEDILAELDREDPEPDAP